MDLTACCSPSIASTPLCRADGTTVLLVVRSGCAECGQDAGDPAVAGWIDPASGTFTAGPAPADAGPCDTGGCCSPSITSTTLCRQDGSTVLVVVRSGCAECGEDAGAPAVVGWLDPLSGVFTPGPAPADSGPCDAGCLDTVCRTRCDDTDGDGAADTTYTELWCIKPDGSAELVLTYQDDPSTPYTPTSPVGCEYGCQETETLTLCDDGGPFLRRMTWLNGTATYEDFALDGVTPHPVTGTVRVCAEDNGQGPAPCEEQTTPAATLGLCLPDGTPLAVLVTRDCAGTVTQDGWLNLTTGTYTSGPPPVGAMACGDSRAFELAGLLCDTDPASGDVLGLVLVEYSYNTDGSLASVRLVDPGTGNTYTLQGELRRCPDGGSQQQPEQDLTVLCDTTADGTVTAFVRDYRRDSASGQITGHTDYGLDGAPYAPAGAVGRCANQCRDCGTVPLCDVPPNTDTAPILAPANTALARSGTLANGVSWSVASGTSSIENWWPVALLPSPSAGPLPVTFDRAVSVEWGARVGRRSTGVGVLVMPPGTVLVSLAPEHLWDPATRMLSSVATAGPVSETSPVSRFMHPGPVTELEFATDGTGGLNTTQRAVGDFLVTPVTTAFLRTVCRDCDGAVTSVTDTLLDGVTPHTPTGAVGTCTPAAEPCRDASSTLLCDTVATDTVTVLDPANRPNADGWEVVSFTGANPGAGPEAAMPYPARYGTTMGVPALAPRADQNGGGPGSGTGYDTWSVRWVLRKTFTAPEDGVAVAQSVAFRGDGAARVRINGIDAGMYGQWNQPATSGTAQIPVTAGPNTVEIEVRDGGGPNYVTGRLDIALPRTTQFMRRQTVDCETGEVIATHDTTLDGLPYTVTGEVGQCTPAQECCEAPPPETRVDVETALLCVRDQANGEITGQVIAERVYDDQSGDLVKQRLTDLAGDPYTLPAGSELTKCPSPDRITRQVCVVESGSSEFLTNEANAASGVDTDWQWAPDLTGLWHPMYRVTPNPVWTATDTAPNKAHWVSPHANRTVCPTAGETSPPVPGTWYTRASWNLPANVAPDTIRIAATVLNADNKVQQWRLNDGAWQPVAGGLLANPAWAFPPTAVPGGRAGQNEIVVQILETQPAVSCPSPNEAGMILHVIATYDYEPRVWTQVIEPGGQVYYLDENGDRQDTIPAGQRLVPCGSGGDAACCPEPEPCGDTELTQLCDLVYSPAPPIPLPAGTFTLTGNVTAGGVLAYSGGDVPPNGVAARTVSGLLPGIGYQFRFSTSWGGIGLPDPAAQSAVYLVEVLDGTTVIASQTRNISNGAGASPGFVAEAPVQFVAPASGAVTVRISDRSPGVALNRDLLVLPEDVRSDVLTVQSTPFLRAIVFDCAGAPTGTRDLALDGTSLYEVRGEVGTCSGDGSGGGGAAPGPDTEVVQLCDLATDGTSAPFLRQLTFQPGADTPTVTDTALDGVTPYTPSGAVGVCGGPEPECPAENVLSACRCDDTDGDGLADTEYVELLAVDCTGVLTSIGTYTSDLAAPYTPTAPVDCTSVDEGAEPALGVQAGRVELLMGGTWDAATVAALRSVTATAHTGTGEITTADGTSTLFQGESVTWSTQKEGDALLAGPLTITAVSGIVTVTYTRGVTL
ncbi:hypothetical protein ACFC09_15560 [Streptomyces sp. NPDC056161]|uniref:hypothetical protein n=1 Tax=Streptomyces sp. NPDC056161 TaxID=3345732 RepID=UPI0035DA650F